MTTIDAVEAAPDAADGTPAPALPAPVDVPLHIDGELGRRLAGTGRWQQ